MRFLSGFRWMAVAAAAFIVLPAVGLLVAASINSDTPTLYKATSTVRVFNPYRIGGSDFGQVDLASIVGQETSYARSAPIRDAARAELDQDGAKTYDNVKWVPQLSDGQIAVDCYAADPEAAATCANTYAAIFVESRSEQAGRSLNTNARAATRTLKSLQRQLGVQQSTIVSLDSDPARQNTVRSALQQQSSLLSRINAVTATITDIRSQAEVVKANYGIVDSADPPTNPSQPLTNRNLAAGFIAGLLAAAGVAVLVRPRRGTDEVTHDADLA